MLPSQASVIRNPGETMADEAYRPWRDELNAETAAAKAQLNRSGPLSFLLGALGITGLGALLPALLGGGAGLGAAGGAAAGGAGAAGAGTAAGAGAASALAPVLGEIVVPGIAAGGGLGAGGAAALLGGGGALASALGGAGAAPSPPTVSGGDIVVPAPSAAPPPPAAGIPGVAQGFLNSGDVSGVEVTAPRPGGGPSPLASGPPIGALAEVLKTQPAKWGPTEQQGTDWGKLARDILGNIPFGSGKMGVPGSGQPNPGQPNPAGRSPFGAGGPGVSGIQGSARPNLYPWVKSDGSPS